jgi:hypothetical protein
MHGVKKRITQMISKFLGTFIFATLAFGVTQAIASDTSVTPPNTETTKTIQGSARFEEHHTIIPLFCTQQQGCAKSRPYWALVVNSSGVNYELDAQFDLGSNTVPQSITVNGVVVNSGALISLEGTVEYSGDHYVILNGLRSVGIVRSDLSNDGAVPIVANFINWSCHGQLDEQTQVMAEIWFAGSTATEENRYHVRVSGSQNDGKSHQSFNIGYVEDAQVSRDTGQLVYDGKNSDISFRVSIQSSDVNHDAPGTLNLTVERPILNQTVPMDEQVDIVCNRTR